MAQERLRVLLELVAGQYKREAREAASATGKIADGAKKAGSATGKMRDQMVSLGTAAKLAVAGAAAFAVKKFVSESIVAARDLSESINAVNKVFGEAADTVLAFGEISAQTAGLSNREFNSLATVTGALLTNLGFSMDQAAEQSIRLTARASDMASVFNTDVATALEAINSGLKGEANPLEQFGVKLNDAAIRAKAVELGLADTTAAVDDNGKAVAALELIYEQTDRVQGDFLQTSGDLANAQRRAAAEAENAAARFGKAWLPVATGLQNFAADVLLSFQAIGGSEGAKAALRIEEAVRNINQAIEEGRDPFTALADSLLHLAVNGELTRGQFEALAAQAGLSSDKFDKFREIVLDQAEAAGVDAEILDELAAAMTETDNAGDGAETAIDGVGDAAETAAEKTQRLEAAQRALTTAMLEAANPALAAVKALERYQAAQQKVIDLQAEGTASSEEIARARVDEAVAALEAQAAADAFDASGVMEAAAAIALGLGEADSVALGLLETLGLIDGTTVTTVIDVNTRTSGAALPRAFDRDRTFRQHGGPVEPSQLYQVGEQNKPELMLIPGDRGQILSNADTRRLIAAVSGGSGTRNLNVNFINPRLADDPMEGIRNALAMDALP